MSKEKITRVKYFTPDKERFIYEENWKKYEKYLQSNIIKNRDVKDTTYKRYRGLFRHFLMWLGENYGELDLYSDEFMENAVDIMEAYMLFCQETLMNHKKIINMKISAVSSFYIWSMKRGFVKYHPFDGKLDRMKKANEEQILNHYFLNDEQIAAIRADLYKTENNKWTIQDQLLFEIALFSANRIGALEKLTISSLDLDNMVFESIREKEGYRVEVSFDSTCKDMLETWLAMRTNDYDHLECDALFIHKYKDKWIPWTQGMIHDRMRKIGRIIGLEDFHCHCIRKTAINKIYEDTGDLNLASQWANHKSTSVTSQSYVRPASKADLREKLKILKFKQQELQKEAEKEGL